jgi:tRNA threonylcarbamoyladenosine biosynthesis protein TsaB
MKVLAIDTALGACSAAVLDDDTILAHCFETMDRGHAERLAPMVREVMQEAGIGFPALDRLGVTTGPGTFTGQRVGISFMRGLRIALKRPLVGVTTLECMLAAALQTSGLDAGAALHDARRGEVYCAASSKGELTVPVCVMNFDDATARLRDVFEKARIAIAGTAGEKAANVLRASGVAAEFTGILQPDALWVARLSAQLPAPSSPPRPLYLREPDAKLPAPAQR